jgi:hypothetical protein
MFTNIPGISAAEFPWVVAAVGAILVFGYLLTRNIAAF